MPNTSRKSSNKQLALRESAERVWLAGLGALALTEEQGSKFFKSLVKKGEGFERLTRAQWDKQVATVRQAPSVAIRRIEGSVEHGMTDVLHRLGIPTRREIHSLTRRVELLADSLEKRASSRKRRNGAATRAKAIAKHPPVETSAIAP